MSLNVYPIPMERSRGEDYLLGGPTGAWGQGTEGDFSPYAVFGILTSESCDSVTS